MRSRATGEPRPSEGARADRAAPALEHAENAIQRAIARQTLRYEASMIFLASIVSGAPFIGLLGTVWGVMDRLQRGPSTQQTAGIQQLAPGVSPALLATIAGLVVAIPSVFGYNFSSRHPAHDHRTRELRQLAGRPHRARVEQISALAMARNFRRQRTAHPICRSQRHQPHRSRRSCC
jgi:biopolymer transport protein ExbB/TolQ